MLSCSTPFRSAVCVSQFGSGDFIILLHVAAHDRSVRSGSGAMATLEEQPITKQEESPPQEHEESPPQEHEESPPEEQEGAAKEGAAPEASSGTPSDLIEWFNSTVQQYDATFIIYYRGLW